MPPLEQTDRVRVLVSAFEGHYPAGSLGNDHGRYIACETMCGLYAFEPNCVVLDFRKLEYRWGNTLLKVFQDISQLKDTGAAPDEPPFPVIVVTSPLCSPGFLSLVTPCGGSAPTWHFDDVDAAITYAVRAANERLNF